MDAKVSERNAVVEDLGRQLNATREKWGERKNEVNQLEFLVENLMRQKDNLENENMQLQNMLYGVIGMLSEQNAETVLSQLDKLQRVTKGW